MDPGSPDVRRSASVLPTSVAVLLGLTALAVRAWHLDHFSYWLDEILQSFAIHDSWRGMWHTLSGQGIQAPLDYAVGKLLEGLHPSDAVRKLPAVVWGTATVVIAARLIARRAGVTAGIVTGLLLAVSPFHVRYSQELRPYSLGMLLLCASLLALERHLARPSVGTLTALYVLALATAYALYVAALGLLVAGTALVAEDCFSADARRARSARRFLAWSPLFGLALWVGFLPWWPAFLTGLRSAPMGVAPRISAGRILRFVSFFGFAHADGQPPGWPGIGFGAGGLAGAVLAWRTPRLRFLLAWSVAGFAILEVLEQHHPVFDSIFHYTPMGLSLAVLFSLPISRLISTPSTRRTGIALLIVSVVLAAGSLHGYFRDGRPDWRPLGAFLRAKPKVERIITETDSAALCVAYYVAGPDWFLASRRHAAPRSIVSLGGDPRAIAWLREPGKTAWLVLAGGEPSAVKRWSEPYRGIAFPGPEGGAVVKRLDGTR